MHNDIVLTVALLVMVVGLILYALPNNPKTSEIGRLMFLVGLFFVLASVGGRSVRL